MLYIFGGLPGAGKTTLARELARTTQAIYLRVDTIEQAIRASGIAMTGPEGYVIAYQVAQDNLALGLSVVADTVNPIAITRSAWRRITTGSGAPYIEIEVVCSNVEEHKTRVETRVADIPGFALPAWRDVAEREYEPWLEADIRIDTAGRTPAESFQDLERLLRDIGPEKATAGRRAAEM